MTALIGWGYPASDVEQLLIPGDDATSEPTDPHPSPPTERELPTCGQLPRVE
jgi:hypothetical protein